MVKNLYFDYCALLILLLLIITYAVKKAVKGRTNRIFLYLIVTITYATLYDICAVLLDNRGAGSEAFKYLMHCGYLLIRNFIPVVYVCYVITLTDTWHYVRRNNFLQIISYLPYAAVFFFTITTPWTKLMFYLNENSAYTRGPLFFLFYLCASFYSAYGLIYAFKFLGQLTIQRFIPLILIVPFQIISIIIQFFNPSILIEMLFSALAVLLVMLTIQRPEAMHDQITGLLKMSIFSNTVRLACLNKKDITILLITITNYKTLSSYLDYDKSSELTAVYGKLLSDIVDKLDLETAEVYYLGLGEYSIILDQHDLASNDKLISMLNEELSKSTDIGSMHLSLPSNICVVNIPEDFDVFEEFLAFNKDIIKLKYSEKTLYAKDLIKSTDYTVIANIDSILSDAIKNRSFEVYYQPIYSTNEERFNSAEALIRLKTEKYGFIRPDLFIPLAEENGLINEIDEIVFEDVCKFISSNEFKHLNIDYIEVNLSVVQCLQPDLPKKILDTMSKYNVEPHQINLEITETAAEYATSVMEHNIITLHNEGISFSLDDFGTGYSNMVRISSLPLHIVKLDRAFTFTENNEGLQKILYYTVDMVKKMDLRIVIEGVETEEKLKEFTDLGCDYIQGYYFSRPLPKDDFIKYISERQ